MLRSAWAKTLQQVYLVLPQWLMRSNLIIRGTTSLSKTKIGKEHNKTFGKLLKKDRVVFQWPLQRRRIGVHRRHPKMVWRWPTLLGFSSAQISIWTWCLRLPWFVFFRWLLLSMILECETQTPIFWPLLSCP